MLDALASRKISSQVLTDCKSWWIAYIELCWMLSHVAQARCTAALTVVQEQIHSCDHLVYSAVCLLVRVAMGVLKALVAGFPAQGGSEQGAA